MPESDARLDTTHLDQSLAELQLQKGNWAVLPIEDKLELLRQLRDRTWHHAERWVEVGLEAKGIEPDSPYAGEEWSAGPWATLHGINIFERALEALAKGERLPRGPIRTRPDGQVIVRVSPLDRWEWLLLNGFSAEVWMEPGVTAESVDQERAGFYRQSSPEGRVVLILGAGNIASIAPLDVLTKMFGEGLVCMLKMNPVNDYQGPVLEEICAPLIERGYLRMAYGGAEVGAYLTRHQDVDVIHMTGSAQTYDAIVFGPGEEGAERKRRGEPILDKPITSELGGVTPTIVVPGPWNKADVQFQAEHIATQKLHNSGFNCVASQVLVLPEAWGLTPRLLEALHNTFQKVSPRNPYYPGAAERQQRAVEAHPAAQVFEADGVEGAPRTLITSIDPGAVGEICFDQELFGPVLAQTTLGGDSAGEFLENAVQFANDRLMGTLSANLIVHPQTIRELGNRLEEAVATLRYGTVGVNAWSAAVFLLSQASWGAYPGHTLTDIQSGIGVVHNALLFDRPQKSVVWGPFRPFPRTLVGGGFHWSPKPAWFVTNRQAHKTFRRITRFAADRRIRHLPGIYGAALRG